jgi:tetratricopeptide (TPR) repeat protein
MNNEFFEKSKIFFESRDISNTLESYEKAISYIDPKEKSSYIQFLNHILKYCKENQLEKEEAVALRSLGRTHSIFKQYVESLRYHEESLRIQRKLGNKTDVAEGLLFLAEDLEVSGNYDHCLKAFEDATEIFGELGKHKKAKEIQKEVDRLRSFSKQMVEEEAIMRKFHVDNF